MPKNEPFNVLEKNISLLYFALNNISEAAYLVTEEGFLKYVNKEACRILGYNFEELLSMNVSDIDPNFPPEIWSGHWEELIEKKSLTFESQHRTKDGKIIEVEINANYFVYNNLEFNLALVRNITERKETERKHKEYLNFLTAMDRVNKKIQVSSNINQLMSDVLDVTISIFDCDRAWLLHPLDPDVDTWCVPKIRWKDGYAVTFPNEGMVKLKDESREAFRIILESKSSVVFGPREIHPIPQELVDDYSVISQITMGIYPKIGKPWMFSLQQCSRERIWSTEEIKTFEQIGSRLNDAISSMMYYNNLHVSEEKYRRIIETSHEGIMILDIEEKISFVNKRLVEILNYSEEEMLGRFPTDFMFEEDRNDHLQKIQNRKNNISETYDRKYRGKDGKEIWTIVSATPLFKDNGEFNGSFAMISDISDRKQMEEQILKLNRLYKTLASCNEALVHANDEDELLNKICELIVSEGGYKMSWVGYSQNDENYSIKPVAIAGYENGYLKDINISWADNNYGNGPTGKAIRTGKLVTLNGYSGSEYNLWKESAEKRGYKSSAAFPLTADTKTFGALNIYSDFPYAFVDSELQLLQDLADDLAYGIISIRTKVEIQELNLNLEQRVEERTKQFELLNKDLESFSYSVSHDLRAPLFRIEGYMKLLETNVKLNLNSEGKSLITSINKSTQFMTQLINDILSFSRTAYQDLNFTSVDLSKLVTDLIDEFETELKFRKVHWNISSLPKVWGDEILLRQVFANLISNALKFTAQKIQAIIDIGHWSTESENVFFVQDNGAGFDMKYVNKLFGAFERLHSKEEYNGTGIGLSNVRRIIEKHGGRTWAEGEVNKGAIFYFSIPLIQ